MFKYFEINKDISILGSFIKEFNSTPGDLNQIRKVPSNTIDINLRKKFRNPFNHMTVAFKKTAVEEVGGYKDMPGYEDYYLWLRLLNILPIFAPSSEHNAALKRIKSKRKLT